LQVFDNRDGGFQEFRYNFVACSSEFLKTKTSELRTDPSAYLCLPSDTNIKVAGNFMAARLNLEYCNPSMRQDFMSKEDTIKSLKGNLQMNMVFENYYTNSINYDDPFVFVHHTELPITDHNTFSRQTIYFKRIDYFTDTGWILEEL
jgi:hypothetical protein